MGLIAAYGATSLADMESLLKEVFKNLVEKYTDPFPGIVQLTSFAYPSNKLMSFLSPTSNRPGPLRI